MHGTLSRENVTVTNYTNTICNAQWTRALGLAPVTKMKSERSGQYFHLGVE